MKKFLLTERSILIFCIAVGAAQAWICRYSRIPDGIAYLDIADAYFRHDWSAAVNAYWSPMYSWWLGLALYFLKPSIRWESIVVHLVNLIIYVAAVFSFRFFMRTVLRALRQSSDSTSDDAVPLPEIVLLILGYSLFLWAAIVLIDVGEVTPDLLLAAIVFLIAGYLIDLRTHWSYWKFGVFGALNGAAYLTKGIMFPLAFGFLAILLFSGRVSKSRIFGVVLAAAVFLIVCSPFILALSKAKGRLTFGDTGKLNYAALVNPGTPQRNWQGEPAGSGIPKHPTRKLLDNPAVFEFGTPIKGTYPAWDDPAYWNEGLKWSFRLRSQAWVLLQSAFTYEKLLLGESGLLAGTLIFLFMGGAPARRAIIANWPLLAAALLSLAAYSLVLVLTRYIGASIVLLFVAVFAGIRLRKSARLECVSKFIAAATALTILLTVAAHMTDRIYTNMTFGDEPRAKEEVETAVALRNLGAQDGDKFSVVGRGITNQWARWGRFRIVAEAAPGQLAIQEFWALPPERRESAYECLRHTGAKAVVAWNPPSNKIDSRWKRIGDTNYYAYFF